MSRRREAARHRMRGGEGFTLVETLVAFVVLATILSVLFRGVVGLRQDAVVFDNRAAADVVAHAVFEEALAKRDLPNGTSSGIRDHRRWTLTASAVDLKGQMPPAPKPLDDKPPAQGQAPNQPPAPNWVTQRLVLDVDTGGTPVRIETIRLAAMPQRKTE